MCLKSCTWCSCKCFSVLSCETELCRRKTHSHLELDGVHYGFYRGSVTLRLGLVICWRPWPPQPPAPCLSELCPQGARQCTGGGQPPHPGRSKVNIKPGILSPLFAINPFQAYELFFLLYWSISVVFVVVSGERLPCWQLARACCQHGVTSWTTPYRWCAPIMMSTPMCFLCSTYARWNTWPTFSRLWFIGLRPWTSRPL